MREYKKNQIITDDDLIYLRSCLDLEEEISNSPNVRGEPTSFAGLAPPTCSTSDRPQDSIGYSRPTDTIEYTLDIFEEGIPFGGYRINTEDLGMLFVDYFEDQFNISKVISGMLVKAEKDGRLEISQDELKVQYHSPEFLGYGHEASQNPPKL